MFCQNCGAKIEEGSKFCVACGKAAGAAQAPTSAPSYSAPTQTAPPVQQPDSQLFNLSYKSKKLTKVEVAGDIVRATLYEKGPAGAANALQFKKSDIVELKDKSVPLITGLVIARYVLAATILLLVALLNPFAAIAVGVVLIFAFRSMSKVPALMVKLKTGQTVCMYHSHQDDAQALINSLR